MSHRVFCESLQSESVVIEDAEAHHLLHVLRLKVGDFLVLFDGCGTEADATITRSSRREVFCNITVRRQTLKTSSVGVTVIAAPPKADRLRWMVEKLTEIGVERLMLLQTDRTVITPSDSRIEKLRSSVIGACKQCRRNHLMQLSPLQSLTSVLDDVRDGRLVGELRIAHPAPEASSPKTRSDTPAADQLLLIGPEGGFTDAEVQAAVSAGATLLAWPGTILRIETAAVVFAAHLLAGHGKSAISQAWQPGSQHIQWPKL